MGTKSSKTETISSNARKRYSQDDLQSRATALTDESSLPPPPNGTANVPSSLQNRLNSGYLKSSAPHNSRWPSMLPSNESSMEVLDPSRHNIQNSHALPPAKDGSKITPPVKLPQNNQGSLQQESEEARYLAKMYDSRTWEMYRRITEARKKSSYKNTAPSIPESENTSEWENLQQEEDTAESGHGMFFLFDFE